MKNQNKAFTLVELIVVITILAILGTIAYLSYQGYSSSARDSKRISDISNIAKGLQIVYATTGKYPRSGENEIGLYGGNISDIGNILGYQASAGKNILSRIKMSSEGGIDPIDNSYYTYSTNKKQNKFQVLGFLENSDNVVFEGSNANFTGNISRYPFTKGDELGILIENTGSILTPFQYLTSLPSNIDITNSSFVENYPDVIGITGGKDEVVSGNGVYVLINNYLNTNIGEIFYMGMSDGIHGNELWKTNGTSEGTVLVKDINIGVNGSNPANFISINGTTYFTAYNIVSDGDDLWKTDGTYGGTKLVKANYGRDITKFGNNLYYLIGGNGLRKTDGINEVLVKSGTVTNLKIVGNIGYFISGSELRKTDGTNEILLKNGVFYLSPVGDEYYFIVNNTELWRTESANIVKIDDIESNSLSSYFKSGNNYYSKIYNSVSGESELWKYIGTDKVLIYSGDHSLDYSDGNNVYYSKGRDELRVYNGSTNILLKNQYAVDFLEKVGNDIFYSVAIGNDGQHRQLWKTNGTVDGTLLVKDFSIGKGLNTGSYASAIINNNYYLCVWGNGCELWKTDGVNTTLVLGSWNGSLIESGTNFYTTYNNELWKLNGNSDIIVKDGYDGNNITLGNYLYFGLNNNQLWKTDGNTTALVKNGTASNMKVLGSKLYFTLNDSELWVTDGNSITMIKEN